MSPITGVSKYAYGNDSRGRRSYVIRTGSAFAQGHQDAWGYNDRDELTASRRYNNTTPESTQNPDTSLDRVYAYDPIGNRTLSRDGTDPNTLYAANSLNQYDPVTKATTPQSAQRLSYDDDGNLVDAYLVGDFNGDGSVGQADLGILMAAYGKCESDPNYNPDANLETTPVGPPTCDDEQQINQGDLGVLMSLYGLSAPNTIRANFTWDAENRLVAWEPSNIDEDAKKVEFKYDYQGRRIEKKVYTRSGSSWNLSQTRRFVWNDWLLLLELDEDATVQRKLTWGLDLAGQRGPQSPPAALDSAGGIGGLLATSDPNDLNDPNDLYGDFVFCYDANGNVGQLIDLAEQTGQSAIKAHYEYDPYGNVIVQSGTYASTNPYRFSTKPWDDETGLGYWGERYYDPRLGRWINHDPIGELGGLNLYAYVSNNPHTGVDPVGTLSLWTFGCVTDPEAPTGPSPCESDAANQACAAAEGLSVSDWCGFKNIYCNWDADLSWYHYLYLLDVWMIVNHVAPDAMPPGVTNDKWKHCFYGCAIGVAVGAKLGCAAGNKKECNDLTDCNPNTHFEIQDAQATCEGAMAGERIGLRRGWPQKCAEHCDKLWPRNAPAPPKTEGQGGAGGGGVDGVLN